MESCSAPHMELHSSIQTHPESTSSATIVSGRFCCCTSLNCVALTWLGGGGLASTDALHDVDFAMDQGKVLFALLSTVSSFGAAESSAARACRLGQTHAKPQVERATMASSKASLKKRKVGNVAVLVVSKFHASQKKATQ